MINEQNLFDQPVKNNLRTIHIQNITTGQEDDYTAGFLLDYPYFKKYYKLISIDSSKQEVLDADPKAIQQIDFYWKSRSRWGGSTEVTLKYWSNSSNGSTEGTNGTEVTLNLSSNVVGNSNDETNFHKLLLTNAQVLKLRKAFVNGSSANIKFSKTQLSKMI